jgi:hypothetical protein
MKDNGYNGSDTSLHYHLFETSAEFAEACDNPTVRAYGSDDKKGWAGGTFDEALAFARHGDMKYVADAERLVEKIDSEIDTDGVRPMWTPSVVGNFPLVPAYLAGTPEAMLARTDVPDARGDMDLWVEMGVSCNVAQSNMRRRGVCVLAAAMALSRVRNVRLTCFTAFKYNNMAIRLGTPLDVSEVCGMITQTSVTRRLMYNYSDSVTGGHTGIPWAEWGVHAHDPESYRAPLVKYAGMPEDAELITMQRLGDWCEMTNEELVETINKMLRRAVGKEDCEQ